MYIKALVKAILPFSRTQTSYCTAICKLKLKIDAGELDLGPVSAGSNSIEP